MDFSNEPWKLWYGFLSLTWFRIGALRLADCSLLVCIRIVNIVENVLYKRRFIAILVDSSLEAFISLDLLPLLRFDFLAFLDQGSLEFTAKSRDLDDWVEHFDVVVELFLFFDVLLDCLILELKLGLKVTKLVFSIFDLPFELGIQLLDFLFWLLIEAHHLFRVSTRLHNLDVPIYDVELLF